MKEVGNEIKQRYLSKPGDRALFTQREPNMEALLDQHIKGKWESYDYFGPT